MQQAISDPIIALATVALILSGYLSTLIYSGLKQFAEKIINLGAFGPTLHTIGSTVLSFLVGFVAVKLGLTPDAIQLGPLTPELVSAVLTTLISAGIYRVQNKSVASVEGLSPPRR